MVQVRINGKDRELPEAITLLQLLQERGIDPRVVVVEYNYEIVPRERYGEITLRDGDTLEIVADDRRRLTMRVLVVGAGVIGAAVAWELLQRGAEVVLLGRRGRRRAHLRRLRRDGEPVQPHAR
jgi:sulfur carrier protein